MEMRTSKFCWTLTTWFTCGTIMLVTRSLLLVSLYCYISTDAYPYPYVERNYDSEEYESSQGENINEMDRMYRSTSSETLTCGIRPEPVHLSSNNIPFGVHSIVGGSSSIQRWPWQVLLVDRRNMKPLCGGVLIATQHVLTAAHCFDDHERENIDVILGEHDRSKIEGTEQIYSIQCLFIHKKYVNKYPYHHDIAMIRIRREFGVEELQSQEETENISPVCLPTKSEFKKNDICVVTGWGYTSAEDFFAGRLPNVLQEGYVPLINSRVCKTAYGTLVTKQMQCAGHLEGSHRADTCKTDSGGPLVCQDSSGRFKLWGITSWGNNLFCQLVPSGPVPGVYTRVDKYLKWIQNKMLSSRCK